MSHKLTITAAVVPLLLSACLFDFGRSTALEPGDIGARAVERPDDVLEEAPFARVVPEGSGRVFYADGSGIIRVRGLAAGGWTLRLTDDSNGDGLPEWATARSAELSVLQHSDGLFGGEAEPKLTWVDLGDVELRGVVEVEGTVSRADGQTRVAGARVYAFRVAESLAAVVDTDGTVRDIDESVLGAEAVTTTDDDGAFRFPALAAGEVSIAAFFDDGATRLATETRVIDALPGERISAGDLTSLRLVVPPDERSVQLELTPPLPRGVRLSVSLAAPGRSPDTSSFTPLDLEGTPGSYPFLAPVGVFDVYVRASTGATALLPSQVSTLPGEPLVVWGLAALLEDPCLHNGTPDCDADGLERLPPFDPTDASAPERATWVACAADCGEAFGTDSTRSCNVDGAIFDCDDDGDDQPDVTEPQACIGLGKGRDSDGDGACDPADPYPQCAEDDPAAAACASTRSDTFVPPPVSAEYGGPPYPARDAGVVDDAGPTDAGPMDAGPVDAGPTDAGPTDAGPTDAGSTDAGSTDAGPTDAGPIDAGPTDAGPPVMISCDAPLILNGIDATSTAQLPKLSQSGDHVVAIWGERGSGYENVAAARYQFTTNTWSAPFDVFAEASPPFTPTYEVAIDADGDVTAIYREVIGGIYTLRAVRYDATGAMWAAEEAATPGLGQVQDYVVDYDRATGEPMLGYVASSAGRNSVWFTKRTGAAWTAPALLENNNADHISYLGLAMNNVGQGIAVWPIDVGGTAPTYYALPYASGDWRRDGMSNPDPFSFPVTSEFFGSSFPNTAMSDNGVGVFTINDSYSTDRELFGAAIDVSGDAAGTPVSVQTGMSPMSIGLAAIAMNDVGHAAFVWTQRADVFANDLPWVTIYDGATWSPAVAVGTYDVATFGPFIDIDNNDVVTVTWAAGGPGVIATRNTGPNGTWLENQQLIGNVLGSSAANVVADDSGDFVVVWNQVSDVKAMRCR